MMNTSDSPVGGEEFSASIRPMRRRDLPDVERLENRSFLLPDPDFLGVPAVLPDAWTAGEIRKAARDPDLVCRVVEEGNDNVVGWFVVEYGFRKSGPLRKIFLHRLLIDPDYRGLGFGAFVLRRLYLECLREAIRDGEPVLLLAEVPETETAVCRRLARAGFSSRLIRSRFPGEERDLVEFRFEVVPTRADRIDRLHRPNRKQ